ncbi:MAG: NUDIX domain-containing protein [Chlamydiales bacterium]|nr:NUDIX domain-containing protein [Chlamydiales bacterium]
MEHSFGIIPLRRSGQEWEALLVKHRKGHWAFPKGHLEKGESPCEAAARELCEETALNVAYFLAIEDLREYYVYELQGRLIEKSVTYFAAEVKGEVEIQAEEIEDFRWASLAEARRLATFPETKALCSRVEKQLSEPPADTNNRN